MKEEVIHTAIDNFQKTTGLVAFWKMDVPLDGTIQIEVPNNKLRFTIEYKTEVRPHQVNQLEKRNAEYKNFLIVANRIFPKVKEELRRQGIAYLEASGNAY